MHPSNIDANVQNVAQSRNVGIRFLRAKFQLISTLTTNQDHRVRAQKISPMSMCARVYSALLYVCVFLVLLSSWSRDECHASLRPRLADPPLPCLAARRDPARRVKLVPHPRVGDDSGENSGTWAVSRRTTPNRVAPLPARRARQMFFVADYDAVCAIMTTSLFLSPAPSLSFHLMPFLPLAPRITALGGWIFSFSFCLSFSHIPIFSLPTRTNFALASAARYHIVSDTRKGD